jgi:hypothetical protein
MVEVGLPRPTTTDVEQAGDELERGERGALVDGGGGHNRCRLALDVLRELGRGVRSLSSVLVQLREQRCRLVRGRGLEERVVDHAQDSLVGEKKLLLGDEVKVLVERLVFK